MLFRRTTPEMSRIAEPFQKIVQDLRDRISELEDDNACLRGLEDVIRRNAKLFQVLLAKNHDGIVLLTPQMTVLRLVHSIAGNDGAEFSGAHMCDVVHPDDFAAFEEAFTRLLNSPGQPVFCEFRVARSAGGWLRVSTEMTDLLDDSDIQAIVLNCHAVG